MGRACRILLVDDDQAVREVVTALLETEGFKVQQAGSAEEALELWGSFAPELIVTDNSLPGMLGVAAVALIRSKVDIPVVLFSGTVNEEVLSAAKKEGIHVVQKPYVGKLLEVIRGVRGDDP